MFDSYNRNINYLRISVTDRCNLRCTYCMPEDGVQQLKHDEVISYEEIYQIVNYAVSQGVTKIRITGGEPLVRKGIVSLVMMLSEISGIDDLSMTTNGIRLKEFAKDLKSAGLHRLNISLDTLDPERYRKITRGGNLEDVLAGIQAAKEAKLFPIKINCVIKKSSNNADAVEVKNFAEQNELSIRYIHQMDLDSGEFSVVEGGDGGNCKSCNRLRLTANGYLKPCLFSDLEYSIRELGVEKAFELAVKDKPACGTVNKTGQFYNIGG